MTVGIALDATRVAIAWRASDAPGARWRSATVPCDGSPEAVRAAIDALATHASSASTAHATLARPLAQVRAVRLPRMARAALEAVLERDWTRHVIGHRATPHAVSARATDRGRWLAAFAPADLLETLSHAMAAQGWPAAEIRTGDDTLAAAARALAPSDGRAPDCFVFLCDPTGVTDAAHLRGGLPWVARRFLSGAGDADVAGFMQATPSDGAARAPVLVLGHATHTTPLARALGAQGIRVSAMDLSLPAAASAVELLAVASTIGSATLPLRSPAAQQERTRRTRATTRWLALATAAALLAALGMERWRVQRDLRAIERARAEISAPVSTAIAARSGAETAADVAGALAEREANATRVSGVLAAVALALPAEASLTALRVAADSVTVEGESARSAAVYDALRAVPALEQVKLAAPLRQERQVGGVVVERFAFSARIRQPTVPTRTATR